MAEMAKVIPSAGQQLSSLQANVKTLLDHLHSQRCIKREVIIYFFFKQKVKENQEKCKAWSAEKGKAGIWMMVLPQSGQQTKKKQGMSVEVAD